MHVDGFRFDLAATLGREGGKFDQYASFFDLIAQDPVVSRTKLIAEPWDVGQMDSYDLGRFPAVWREWNGQYRDSMRDFWRSADLGVAEFATRFSGSSDLYGARPAAADRLGQPDHRARRLHASATWSPTTASTTRPTASTTGTAPTTTARGTAVPRARPTTRKSTRCAPGSSGRCSPRCCCPSACRCCSAATRSAAPRAATTTPTARTTRSPGSTGTAPTGTCWPTSSGSSRCAGRTRSSAASAS